MQIALNQVSYVYNSKSRRFAFCAVNDINHKFAENKITGIIGGAGSGKSTFIQLCNALLLPTSGEVKIGKDIVVTEKTKKIKEIKKVRQQIGMVFQFPEAQLFCETVEKDIMFGPKNMGKTNEEAKNLAKKYITAVGLDESYLSRSPFELSGGQKRRVAIAGILALESDVLILDEPTAGLDPQGEIEFNQLFKTLNKKLKKTIIFITHNMDHILEICHEVVVLKGGEVSFVGTPFDVFANEQLILENDLTFPKLFNVVNELARRGYDIDYAGIRTIDDLVKQIKISTKSLSGLSHKTKEFKKISKDNQDELSEKYKAVQKQKTAKYKTQNYLIKFFKNVFVPKKKRGNK